MRKENLSIILEFTLCIVVLAIVEIRAISLSIESNYLKNSISSNTTIENDDQLTISFVGDCTLGTGANYSYRRSFIEKYDNVQDDSYFFSGVKSVLATDDVTIANLEGVLSDDAKTLNPKKYNYKGYTKYVNILKKGSVEMVNLANNHTYDYLEKGYQDTINTLNNGNVIYFGYNNYRIIEIKGIRLGIVGLPGWDYGTATSSIDRAMDYFKDTGVSLIIFNFHWGEMRKYVHNKTQEKIAKYAIDKGADLVIGHHPHVLQGIEMYKGKYIAYSLGNFVYGGIYYPYDSDTVILRMSYDIKNGKVINGKLTLIPASITSSGVINDYRPKILTGNEKKRVLNKIMKYSTNFVYNIE